MLERCDLAGNSTTKHTPQHVMPRSPSHVDGVLLLPSLLSSHNKMTVAVIILLLLTVNFFIIHCSDFLIMIKPSHLWTAPLVDCHK